MAKKVLSAISVRPVFSTGLPPVLSPCEYCKDDEGMYHFCNPDGFLFAVGGKTTVSKVRVAELKGTISIVGGHISHAGERGCSGDNVWTVQNGIWVKV